MNANELELKIQSLVDGVLPVGERESMLRMLEGDSSAKGLYEEIVAVGRFLVPENELPRTLNEDGAFYWSGIASGIERAGRDHSPVSPAGLAPRWLRWLVPALGVAALLVMPLGRLLKNEPAVSAKADPVPPVTTRPMEVAAALPDVASEPLYAGVEVSTVNYFADAGEITVIWVNGDGLAYRP